MILTREELAVIEDALELRACEIEDHPLWAQLCIDDPELREYNAGQTRGVLAKVHEARCTNNGQRVYLL